MTYRPDVDGLRAIAILFVLFFHSGLKLFPSGFIGVDVFFVISGFLITKLIHQSMQNNHFSFLEFYSRRLWRLQPVFVCLLVIATLLALLFYLPDDLVQYGKSARKTSLFVANHYFSQVTTGYFATDSTQLPLLHTWSLAIEWQCYLFLPIVICLLHHFVKQHLSKVIFTLTLIFLVLSLYFSAHYGEKTYYQLLSRIFEFLIGSCVTLAPRHFPWGKRSLDGLAMLALLTLIYIATRSNINLGFPNGYAVVLCLATATLIAVGGYHPQSLITRILSTRPFVFIGLLSYSLYIWHWPIFALIRYEGMKETNLVLFFAFIAAFVLAYLSWRYIEKPARQLNKLAFHYSLIYLVLLPITVIHIGSYLIKNHAGYPERFNKEVVRIYEQLNQYSSAQRPLCIGKKNININTQCMLGAKNSPTKTGFMIGDSYSNHYWGFMDSLAKEANLSILAQATSSCLTLPGIFLYDWWSFKNEVYQECYEQTTRYFNMIKTNHYDYVIIGQTWKNYLGHNIINQLHDQCSRELTKERITAALDKALQIITDSGAKPVLIKATASTTENLHDCFFQHIKQRKKYNPDQCDFNLQANAELWLNDLFVEMKKKYPQLIIIDPKKVQCINGRCKADINGVPVFRDVGHITDYASYQFAKLYLQRYKNPFDLSNSVIGTK